MGYEGKDPEDDIKAKKKKRDINIEGGKKKEKVTKRKKRGRNIK